MVSAFRQAVTVAQEKVNVAVAAKDVRRTLHASSVPEVHALRQYDDTVSGKVSDRLFAQPLMVRI